MNSPQEFLSAFFKPDDTINFRVFADKDGDDFKGAKFKAKLGKLDNTLQQLKEHNDLNRGVFFVVNTGGASDEEVLANGRVTAQFFECDHGSFEEQWKLIESFPVPPSVVVKTQKSLHVYYLVKDGDIKRFRNIQTRFVQALGADPACVNESRVLRVPGFNHCKKDPVMVECMLFEPSRIYTQDEIAQHLPEVVEKPRSTSSGTVDGQNSGLEIACYKCLFLKHCKENPNDLSEHDWYAMITNLAPFMGGRERIHEYSEPYPKYSRRETEAKIDHFFESNTAPIWCETICEKGWKCPNLGKCPCNSPAGLAYQKLSIEDLRYFLDKIEASEDNLQNYTLAKNYISDTFLNVEYDIASGFINEDLKTKFKLKAPQIKELIKHYKKQANIESENQTYDYSGTLRDLLGSIKSRIQDKERRVEVMAYHAYNWLTHNGAAFYTYPDGKSSMHYNKQLIPLSSNNRMNKFIYNEGGILSASQEAKLIIHALADRAAEEGTKVTQTKALYYSPKHAGLYVNLGNEDNELLKISAGKISIIQNGVNEDNVVLDITVQDMEPIKFIPDVDIKKGLLLYKELIQDNTTTSKLNSLFLSCAFPCMFLKDLSAIKPIFKFSGTSSSGKTTASKLWTNLLYGAENISKPTTAALYAMASKDPLIVIDNLEADDMTRDIMNFLLTNSTGITKHKHEMGTISGVAKEKADAIVFLTAIEPLDKPESINRTLDFKCSIEHKKPGFFERKVIHEIHKNRDYILSAFFKMIAYHLLPTLDDLRADAMEILEEKPHKKDRTNEFLSIVLSVLAVYNQIAPELLEGVPLPEVFKKWMDYHDSMAETTEAETDPVLYYMEVFLKELAVENGQTRSTQYDIELIRDGEITGWICTAKDLYTVFSKLSKSIGKRFDFKNPQQLMVRVANNNPLFKARGWEVKKEKTVHGYSYFRYEKTKGE